MSNTTYKAITIYNIKHFYDEGGINAVNAFIQFMYTASIKSLPTLMSAVRESNYMNKNDKDFLIKRLELLI